jgi:hypothetical protein
MFGSRRCRISLRETDIEVRVHKAARQEESWEFVPPALASREAREQGKLGNDCHFT